MFKEFKEFAIKGNVVDLAIGIIIGVAFGAIVTSLVEDVLMPPIGLVLGNVDFSDLFVILKQGNPVGPYATVKLAKDAGAVTMNYGVFFNAIIAFVFTAFATFMVIRAINNLRRRQVAAAPSTKECPHCCTQIPIKATRCPHCTSEIKAA